jgi:hypothetical protein
MDFVEFPVVVARSGTYPASNRIVNANHIVSVDTGSHHSCVVTLSNGEKFNTSMKYDDVKELLDCE